MNITWRTANITDELQSFENPFPLRRNALRRKINRILGKETVKDRPKYGVPKTIQTGQFQKNSKKINKFKKKGQRTFTTESFQNSKKDLVYAEDSSEISTDLRKASKNLIPKDSSIHFTDWIQNQRQNDRRKSMYMTGKL
ncbi:unnamed protein product [Rotaria sordida]|uniref:Uncharacterized protein n=1 Tax=Rotaria sordida TaxID=392033 RepID=A0A814NDU7_9BILA|nr:unnamed protein product [Rotaria sordida]CAF1092192.1 unnamed protein product [Rotaria sordida]CAF3875802.1 unnamed protein product [Rotaria sordida]